jgi:hypothetical protein
VETKGWNPTVARYFGSFDLLEVLCLPASVPLLWFDGLVVESPMLRPMGQPPWPMDQ